MGTTEVIFILEVVGTIAFALAGAMIAAEKNMDIFGVNVLGLTTAVGGGMLRDIMAGMTPFIFVKHVYACASIAGAISYIYLHRVWDEVPAMAVSATLVVVIRMLAAHYKWNLPRIKPQEKK